ncbi:MAG: DUF11 domain-containing protein [Lewinellaceae bacterium]|nr:DUF11 domain-containing protein [Lewinellaceae bacterium]
MNLSILALMKSASNTSFRFKCFFLILFFTASAGLQLLGQIPQVTVRFANPQFNCANGEYCLDVEFQSNTSDQQVFGMNVRFFYDDNALELVDFRNFQGGYAAFAPNPPLINTGGPTSGPVLFNFAGPAEFVNGAMQLVNANAPPIYISTNGWTKLFTVCFNVDDPNANLDNFCPSVVWDLEQNPANGGFLPGDDGVVITLVNPDPNQNSTPAIEQVAHYNWQYVGPGTPPYGVPNSTSCIAIRCIDLELDIAADNPTSPIGGTVVFTVTVSNTGPNPATNVDVTSLLPNGYSYVSDNGGGDYNSGTGLWEIGTLANGATTTLQITATMNPAGNRLMLAEVTAATGQDPDSTPNNGVDTDNDTLVENDPGDEDDGDGAQVELQSPMPQLSVLKTDQLDLGPNNFLDVGDVINYTVTVTNTGNVTVNNIAMTDVLTGGLSCIPAEPITLAPGQSATCTASYMVTQSDINAGFVLNTATATGQDPNGDPVTDTSDDPDDPTDTDPDMDGNPDDPTNTPLPQLPKLLVSKTDALDLGNDGLLNAGDMINYTITVTNAGNMPVSGINLSDPNADPGSITCPLTDLAPGQSMVCSATHTITSTDIDNGFVLNTATATGEDPNGDPVSDPSDDPDNPMDIDPDNDGDPDDPTVTVFQVEIPMVAVRFANPQFDCNNGGVYCLDVEFKSNQPNKEVFGANVRFFYDDNVLEFLSFGDFQGGYGAVAPNPPAITTGAPATGPAWFTFGGAAEFVNGAVQLVNGNAQPIVLSTTTWTKLFQVCFSVDDPNASLNNFCPSVVWDLEEDPMQGGFPIGDDGVVITVVNPDPNEDSSPTIENVLHHNWTYDGTPGTPFGFPVENACVETRCIDLSVEKSVNNPTQFIGNQVVFTITVANAGPDAALDVVLTDQLPSGFNYVSDNSGGAYNSGSGEWTIGTLAVNASVTIQITATVNASGNYVNLAEVTNAVGQDTDSTPDNGVDTDNDTNVDDDPGDEDDGDGVTVTPLEPPAEVSVRFSNPQFDCENPDQYCLDVEFKSDEPNQEIFGTNVRFFYDDNVLEFLNFSDFQGGYGPVAPNPPVKITGAPATGPVWFAFGGPAEFINGAMQLVDNNAAPIVLSTTDWTKLFSVCFTIKKQNANLNNFCPSVVWDLEENVQNGGFSVGSDGVVITVVDPDPNIDSKPTTEQVQHHNWNYDFAAGLPFGNPVEDACSLIRCIDVSLDKSVSN